MTKIPKKPQASSPAAFKSPTPIVRLALADRQAERNGSLDMSESPTVRLATTVEGGGSMSPEAFERYLKEAEDLPALLVSYIYLLPFLENRARYHYRNWVLDSGAYSAHNSGKVIQLQDYIDKAKQMLETDEKLVEVFALDVIGDWKASLHNTKAMWKQGLEAIPCFHYGEPWELLKGLAKDYPKIALGGCVGRRDKDKFAQQCFARVWPKKIHGFGFGSEKSLMLLPWHSVDATNWELAPCKFGTWKSFGGQRVSVRGSNQNLRSEVEWYLDLERTAQQRWKKEMLKLEDLTCSSPTTRLAINDKGQGEVNGALKSPTVRLVGNGEGVTQRQKGAFGRSE